MTRSRWQPATWNRTCTKCGAMLLSSELNSFCCNNGKNIVPRLPPLPAHLTNITTRPECSSISRRLNNLFAFTAIGASKGFQKFRFGLANVAITGRTYHRMLDITAPHHSIHWFLYDEQERVTESHKWKVPTTWTTGVKTDLENCNPYVHHLRQFASMWTHDNETTAALELSDATARGDFAVVMHASNSTQINPRRILIWHNNDQDPTFIPTFSRHYEPLQYPVLFPHGTPGWGLTPDATDSFRLKNTLPFTQRQWYRSLLLREPRFIDFGRLGSEYICDMYSRIEEERLQFIRRGRISQARESNPACDDDRVDIRLPASFLGSREWASNETADSLALAREFGRPSLFITMTCNARWPEITSRLHQGQTAYDIPIIVARAFKLRLQRLQDILRKKFGKLIFMVKIIEFQKRGLPHAHIVVKVRLLILTKN